MTVRIVRCGTGKILFFILESFIPGQVLAQTTNSPIGHVNEYPTMHYFRSLGHTQSMIAYIIFPESFWKIQ